jgi:phosphoserine phosphatase
VSKSKPTGGSCFAVATRDEVEALESALRRRGVLQCGLEDDFLAAYVGHYKDHRRGSANSVVEPTTTRAVVFDFGGTLTVPSPPYNTWERLWLSVGYEVSEVTSLHLLFRQGRISHQEWCDSTCDKLRSRGFSRKHLDSVASKITPVAGVFETFETLTNRGIPIYILSGSIRQIIRTTLGLPAYSLVSEVKCNEILFDDNGLISEINGHDFDFEGKAQFIKRIIQERRCAPIEVLFVGNSFNDQYAARSGARTLCVNPSHTDFSDRLIWSEPCIKELRNLSQILAHV